MRTGLDISNKTLLQSQSKLLDTFCLLALPTLEHRISRVNCDKQNWEGEEMGEKEKKVSQIFLSETVRSVEMEALETSYVVTVSHIWTVY